MHPKLLFSIGRIIQQGSTNIGGALEPEEAPATPHKDECATAAPGSRWASVVLCFFQAYTRLA